LLIAGFWDLVCGQAFASMVSRSARAGQRENFVTGDFVILRSILPEQHSKYKI